MKFQNLRGADLSCADLSCADLSDADLSNADLSNADLRGADLRYAILSNADLSNADLRYAILSNTDLSDANLRGVKINFPIQCPEAGSFIGFKKTVDDKIVKLLITEKAKRSSATSRKCRCSEAFVLEITDINGNKFFEARSWYDKEFVYEVGKTVKASDFDENRWNECSSGIHFFITKQEAIDFNY